MYVEIKECCRNKIGQGQERIGGNKLSLLNLWVIIIFPRSEVPCCCQNLLQIMLLQNLIYFRDELQVDTTVHLFGCDVLKRKQSKLK